MLSSQSLPSLTRVFNANPARIATIFFMVLATTHVTAQDLPEAPSARLIPDAASAQRAIETNERVASFDLAINAEALFKCRKASFWRQGGVDYALLEGDVRFNIQDYGFRASRAIVRVDRIGHPADPELVVRHMSVYLDQARTAKELVVSADADRLLVTAATTGAVFIDADLPQPVQGPPNTAFVSDGYDRIARHFSPLTNTPTELAEGGKRQTRLIERGEVSPDKPNKDAAPDAVLPLIGTVLWDADRYEAVMSPGGGKDATLTLSGNVRLIYQDAASPRVVTLQAQSVVLFMKPLGNNDGDDRQEQVGSSVDAGQIRGIYLEGGVVINDGDYTVRTPRGYYDLVRDKAVLLEAVVYTFDKQRRIPIYVRAEVVRQLARTTFEAEHAVLSNSSFALPHFSVGARRLTVTEQTRPKRGLWGTPQAGQGSGVPGERPDGVTYGTLSTLDGTTATGSVARNGSSGDGGNTAGSTETIHSYVAESVTVQWGRMPVFWWPVAAGDATSMPLKRIQIGSESRIGFIVETEWDFNALLGKDSSDGVESRLKLDWQGDHNVAVGARVKYDKTDFRGELDGYLIPSDRAADELGGRSNVDNKGGARGFYKYKHEHKLGKNTDLQLRSDYASDETVLEVYREKEARDAQQYETSTYLIRQQDDWSVSLLARGDTNDFIPQLTVLQAPGFTVERFPEASFHKIGLPLWDGRLTYFTQNSASYIRANLPTDSPEDRGFNNTASNELFGINSTDPFASRASFTGYNDDLTLRGDSRHEIAAPMRLGEFDVTPYGVGRLTAYSEDNLAPGSDNTRLWGQLGVRASTSFQSSTARVYNPLLDINGLRHIVEPSFNAYYTESSAESGDLLPYDSSVEGINDEPGVRIGMRNTWQTQRGGHGLWRSVDWITWDLDAVFSEIDDDNAVNNQGIARWFGYRPEYVRGGDHLYTDVRWMVTDVFSMTGDMTYLLDAPDVGTTGGGANLAQWQIGGILNPDRAVRIYGSYESIDALDSKLVTYGFTADLTAKYRVLFNQRWDLSESESRDFSIGLIRSMPQWQIGVGLRRDELNEETRVTINLTPTGLGRGGAFGFGGTQDSSVR